MLVVFHEGPMDGVVSTLEDHVREVRALREKPPLTEWVSGDGPAVAISPEVVLYRYSGQRVLVGAAAWAMEFKPEGAE